MKFIRSALGLSFVIGALAGAPQSWGLAAVSGVIGLFILWRG